MSRPDSSRREQDALGWIDVPEDAYYGPQTARAVANFAISGTSISTLPDLVVALALVKLAAARTNRKLGDLPAHKADAIELACLEISAGQLHDQFVVDVFQGGAGTSTNMNANEVIANRALELLGRMRGEYDQLHPNNDVNLSQSTNDVYPTAMRLAVYSSAAGLSESLVRLAEAFEAKSAEFDDILKLGRTQLQDAVPMTLGQEFGAFAITIREDVSRIAEISRLLLEINLGGTAIGTGINADPAYSRLVVAELAEVTKLPLATAPNLVEACWDTGSFVLFSGMLKRTAVKLSKISNDLRLLSSGPRGGFGEINLPPMQPGSSIMPGKVNPVIPEVTSQVAFQVVGADLSITLASEAGQLQLNAMEPLIVFNLLTSIKLLCNAVNTLNEKCIAGITANPLKCAEHLDRSTALATALTPIVGYDMAAALAKEILATGKPMRAILAEGERLSPDLVDKALDIQAMTRPSRLRVNSVFPDVAAESSD
jgi:aspartate ammonia-lyase